MNDNLMDAARAGNIDALYAAIRLKADILDGKDRISFVETPMHVAASAGQTQFAIEIMNLKPSFGKKLNQDGLSPLHLALQCGHYETAKQLIEFDGELVRVKGRDRLTPLHYVARTDQCTDLLAEFLCACPKSIEDVTIRRETALHIVVKSSSHRAVKIILEWLWRTHNFHLLKWKDKDGNTALHIAVTTNRPEIVKLILKKGRSIKNEKNSKGLTGLDIALELEEFNQGVVYNSEVVDILSRAKAATASSLPAHDDLTLEEYLINPDRPFEKFLRWVLFCRKDLTMEVRNAILVVSVLIATATFQAVLTTPGGGLPDIKTLKSADPKNILAKIYAAFTDMLKYKELRSLYLLVFFYILNTVAFMQSISVLILVLQMRPFTFVLHLSLGFLTATYWLSLLRIFSDSLSMTEVAYVYMVISLVLWFLCYACKWLFWTMEIRIMSEEIFWTSTNRLYEIVDWPGRILRTHAGQRFKRRFQLLYRLLG